MKKKVKVIFQPSGRRGEISKGTSVIEASRLLGADIESLCGEKRVCGKCKVRIEAGEFTKFGLVSRQDHLSPWQEEEEIIKIWPGHIEDYYGMTMDVGTTTVAAYLCNLRIMEVLNTVTRMNPQCKYGEDVMSRIGYHMQNEDGLDRMSNDLVAGLNDLVKKACRDLKEFIHLPH